MEWIQPILSNFFKAIENDPRVGVSHISLYCAILQFGDKWNEGECVLIMSFELMKVAKISGGTYHRCIGDLHKYGYIRYVPSYNHRKKSQVYLLL